MPNVQILALFLLAAAAAFYLWRGVQRRIRADERFFLSLVERVSQVVQSRGFRLVRNQHFPNSFGHRIAVFEGAGAFLDLALDGKERDVRLSRRTSDSRTATGEVLADRYLGFYPSEADYDRATAAIVDAIASVDGAA